MRSPPTDNSKLPKSSKDDSSFSSPEKDNAGLRKNPVMQESNLISPSKENENGVNNNGETKHFQDDKNGLLNPTADHKVMKPLKTNLNGESHPKSNSNGVISSESNLLNEKLPKDNAVFKVPYPPQNDPRLRRRSNEVKRSAQDSEDTLTNAENDMKSDDKAAHNKEDCDHCSKDSSVDSQRQCPRLTGVKRKHSTSPPEDNGSEVPSLMLPSPSTISEEFIKKIAALKVSDQPIQPIDPAELHADIPPIPIFERFSLELVNALSDGSKYVSVLEETVHYIIEACKFLDQSNYQSYPDAPNLVKHGLYLLCVNTVKLHQFDRSIARTLLFYIFTSNDEILHLILAHAGHCPFASFLSVLFKIIQDSPGYDRLKYVLDFVDPQKFIDELRTMWPLNKAGERTDGNDGKKVEAVGTDSQEKGEEKTGDDKDSDGMKDKTKHSELEDGNKKKKDYEDCSVEGLCSRPDPELGEHLIKDMSSVLYACKYDLDGQLIDLENSMTTSECNKDAMFAYGCSFFNSLFSMENNVLELTGNIATNFTKLEKCFKKCIKKNFYDCFTVRDAYYYLAIMYILKKDDNVALKYIKQAEYAHRRIPSCVKKFVGATGIPPAILALIKQRYRELSLGTACDECDGAKDKKKLKTCPCKTAFYCSAPCQIKHRDIHRDICPLKRIQNKPIVHDDSKNVDGL